VLSLILRMIVIRFFAVTLYMRFYLKLQPHGSGKLYADDFEHFNQKTEGFRIAVMEFTAEVMRSLRSITIYKIKIIFPQ